MLNAESVTYTSNSLRNRQTRFIAQKHLLRTNESSKGEGRGDGITYRLLAQSKFSTQAFQVPEEFTVFLDLNFFSEVSPDSIVDLGSIDEQDSLVFCNYCISKENGVEVYVGSAEIE